ncbi:MAG TPA: hypothetical protein VNJ12_07580 [Candidatus Dormibacteraeota bacterium]|nr:hypothetical protein [Candidatus Dormibacteraeota bacterium]
MTAANLEVVFGSSASFLLLAWVLLCLWPAQRVDMFRQQLFALRDEAFDLAADGKIAFDHEAYVLLRQLINGFIRYAHNITPFRFTLAFLSWKLVARHPTRDWAQAWNEAVEKVPDEAARLKMKEFYSRLAVLVGGQLVLTPEALALLAPLILIALIHVQWLNLKNAYEAVWFIEEEAVAAGRSSS